jgi:hypothetical protein
MAARHDLGRGWAIETWPLDVDMLEERPSRLIGRREPGVREQMGRRAIPRLGRQPDLDRNKCVRR